MHLTLRFLGDIEKEDIKAIIRAMKTTAATCEPFTLSAQGVGVFPGIKKARVIWAGVRGQVSQLQTLQKTLGSNLQSEGFMGDKKRFFPHFTLGRFKGPVDSPKLEKIMQDFQQCTSDDCLITSMVLYKSDLRPSSAVHTPLFEAVLSEIPSR